MDLTDWMPAATALRTPVQPVRGDPVRPAPAQGSAIGAERRCCGEQRVVQIGQGGDAQAAALRTGRGAPRPPRAQGLPRRFAQAARW